jgi:cystathionine beta-lyase family protein involved in aluminum resistance
MTMENQQMYQALGVSPAVYALGEEVLSSLTERFAEIDRRAEYNQNKVLLAMQRNRVNAAHFAATTGYGYNDEGRDNLERVYAEAFHTEAALVRPQITCGTHALTVALSANLLPGDELLSPVGAPYDTLEEVIGIRESVGSLKEYGVTYAQVDLLPDGGFDYPAIGRAITPRTKMVTIQRSKGYDTRPTFSVAQIGELIAFCKKCKPGVTVMVDNCYGEFTGVREPKADLMAGSLIKNPGGGLAPTGGYVAGKKKYVEKAACRLNAPGIGGEVGSYAAGYQSFYQGMFMAPHTVAQAVKSAILAARAFEILGYDVNPTFNAPRSDIIQAIGLRTPERLIRFIQAIQMCSPVDSEALPEPWDMPGYDDQVVMAAGTFVAGASIELSADGPMRAPYTAYMQGGLTYAHGRLAMAEALGRMMETGALGY